MNPFQIFPSFVSTRPLFTFSPLTPIILVARGCLAPYFLNWWRAVPNPLFVMDFSRWRWFEFGHEAAPRWIGGEPPCGEVILFDRNTTTGQTLRLLKLWLEARGYRVTVMGHMDRNMGRFGVRYVDVVWDDRPDFDPFGTMREECDDVKLVPSAHYAKELQGAYTFCVIGGTRTELNGIDALADVDVRMNPANVPPNHSVVYQGVRNWEQAMIRGYVNNKPLITIAGAPGVTADYDHDADLSEIVTYLREETGGGAP